MRWLILSAAFAASVFASVSVHAQGGNPLPPGDGRDIVAVACTQCHGPGAFTQLRQGPQAWRYEVYAMILAGAEINPGDIEATVSYLATNFGLGVNVPPSMPVSLPDGPGKEIVEGGCALCHGLDRIAGAKRTPADWKGIVNRMIFFGAPLSPDQATAAVAYLDAQFSAK